VLPPASRCPLAPTVVNPVPHHLPWHDTGHKQEVGAARTAASGAALADASVGEGTWLLAAGRGWDTDTEPAPALHRGVLFSWVLQGGPE